MLTDIEIAQNAKIRPITQIAAEMGVLEDELFLFGNTRQSYPTTSLKDWKTTRTGALS